MPLCLIAHDAVQDGAAPDVRDDLVQANAVAGALDRLGWSVDLLAMTLDLERASEALRARTPDLVFNLIEAPGGMGRLIGIGPALFEALGFGHTGCAADAILATSNKPLAKRRLRAAGLPTPAFPAEDRCSGLDGLYIVKSAWEHSSLGLDQSAVIHAGAVPAAIAQRARRHGGRWFAERYIEGREFNVAMIGPAASPFLLPCAEIVFDHLPAGHHRIVDYAAKWEADSESYRGTARSFSVTRERDLCARLGDLALACWHLFGLSGYARVDMRMDAAERLWILEVNANPCLSPDAGFAAAAAEARIGYDEIVDRILRAALGSSPPLLVRAAGGLT